MFANRLLKESWTSSKIVQVLEIGFSHWIGKYNRIDFGIGSLDICSAKWLDYDFAIVLSEKCSQHFGILSNYRIRDPESKVLGIGKLFELS